MPQLKYIMPDWDDYLDWGFNFLTDEFSAERQEDRKLKYFHEITEEAGAPPPYDGILVSLIQIEKKKGVLKKHHRNNRDNGMHATAVEILQNGEACETVRQLMRIPESIKLIGDCGAFTYKDQEQPTITPEDAAALYELYGFDIGASVDHMIVDEIQVRDEEGKLVSQKLTDEEKAARVELTITNAQRYINHIQENHYAVTPLGSIQARSPIEYAEVFTQFVNMGYKEIALGSLIPKNDQEIRLILTEVGERYRALPEGVRSDIHIHLFGILRPDLIPIYRENGVASFDSASYFRKAWLKSDKNYLGVNGEWYPAIRVPQTALPRNRKALEKQDADLVELSNLERDIMQGLNEFNKDSDIDAILDKIMDYDKYFERLADGGEGMREKYRRVLTDRPWEQCSCPICKNAGINVLIFRGYNRNKRRGFHNTYVFYNHQLEDFENEANA